MANRDDGLDVFLRMEQLSAYVRHVAHGVAGDIRGIERVRKTVDETPRACTDSCRPARMDSLGPEGLRAVGAVLGVGANVRN